jgi:hypothetical protein
MKKLIDKLSRNEAGWGANILAGILILTAYGISWALVCGACKLAAVRFGWTYDITTASGLWVLIFAGKSVIASFIKTRKRKGKDGCDCHCCNH